MRLRKYFVHAVMIFISVLSFFWIYILFVNATRSGSEMYGITLIPSKYFFYNMGGVFFGTLPFLSSLINSLFVSIISSFGCIYFASLCAYGFHMYDFRFKKAIFVFLLMIMMVPTQVSTLGYIDLAKKMHLSDTLWSIILPRMSVPVTFYYIYQFMKVDVSKTYVEAARIDGATETSTFHKIIFPILKPALVVQFIYEFVYNWNSYFVPAVMIESDSKRTLAIVVTMLRSYDEGVGYAVIAFSILPVTIMYVLLSKHIISGITAGGIKE